LSKGGLKMNLFISGMWGTVLWIVSVLCIIWVIYDVLAKNKGLSDGMKILWVVLALVLNQYAIIIAIIYYFVYKR
jgi:hypothetical protein